MSVGAKPLSGSGQHVVRMTLVHDKEGKLLVLLPASSLLNLSALWRLTGRTLQPVSCADAQRFFSQEALNNTWGQKQLFNMPCILDTNLDPAARHDIWEPITGLRFMAREGWLSESLQTGGLGLSCELIESVQTASDTEAITQALERFTALRVRQRLEETLGLPAFNQTTQRMIMLRSDADAEVEDLLKIVKLDPSLSAQIMSWAASPYYAAPGRVDSVEDAVIRVLGFDLVVNLALGVAMGKIMNLPDSQVRGATPFWLQSLAMAALAERLCKKMPAEQRLKPGLAYLSGLLHNFGYLLLSHLFPAQFSTLSRYIEANLHLPFPVVEQQVLNLTRDQIGAWLLENWSLPDSVCTAIRYQQDAGFKGANFLYPCLIRVTSLALREQGLSDGPVEPLNPADLEALGLSLERVQQEAALICASQDELKALTELFEA